MLFLDHTVSVPSNGVTRVKRNHFIYVSELIDSWKTSDGSRNTNRRSKIIGRLVRAEPECNVMYPNEAYYELHGLEKPAVNFAQISKPGRKCNTVYAEGAAIFPGFALLAACALIDCQATSILTQCFGQQLAEQIIFMATHYASGHTSLECLDFHAMKHNVYKSARGLNAKNARELIANGLKSENIKAFFDKWLPAAAGDDAIAYDVTALPTQAKNITYAQRGYAHGGPELPQVNYALMCNCKTGMPLYYSSYYGSITDKKNLQHVIDSAIERHLPGNLSLIFDRGFASKANIEELTHKGINFIMGVPGTFKGAMELLDAFTLENNTDFEDLVLLQKLDGTISEHGCRSKTVPFEYYGIKLNLHLYVNEEINHDKSMELNHHIAHCLQIARQTNQLPEDGYLKDARDCIIKEGKGKNITFRVDNEKYREKKRKYGSFALFSSAQCNYNSHDSLRLFRNREIDEEIFNCLKTDLHLLPLRVWSNDAMHGKFFILFISAIIRRHILQKTGDILNMSRSSFNLLVTILENESVELRGDGRFADMSVKSKIAQSVLCRFIDADKARELGIKDSFVHKPKARSCAKKLKK